jgi:DNA-binding transcriptional LysR family regulator
MDLRDLHYFRILAEELNLGRASERIPISQPGLSAAVKRLEGECGVALFDRLPRGVRLTPAGEMLRLHADRVLTAHDNARRSLRAIAASEPAALRLGITPAAPPELFAPALAELMRVRPALRIDVSDSGIDGVRPALLRGDLDLGLVGHGTRAADHPDLHEVDLGDNTFVPVVRRDHPRLAELITPAALMQERFVGGTRASGLSETFEQTTRRLGLGAPRIVATAPDLRTMRELAAATDLAIMLPLTALFPLEVAPLVPLLGLVHLHLPQRLFLVARKDSPIADAAALQGMLSARLAALRDAVIAFHRDQPALAPLPAAPKVAGMTGIVSPHAH